MRTFAVVVNDCAAPNVPGILAVRTRDTDYGGQNFTLHFEELAAGLPAVLTERQLDWLEILGYLFAVDVACERGQGDLEWSRSIQAWLPVRDPDFWGARRVTIEGIWTDLTEDDLHLRFEQETNDSPPPRMSRKPFPEFDGVALLSGGQDSFVGAASLVDMGHRPLLLSHSGSGATNSAQATVEAHLRATQGAISRVRLSARKKPGATFPGSESSQRSRTLLFVGVASLIAAVSGPANVWLNENGIMAMHLPLTAARIGSLSTHTASPPILDRIRRLANSSLGVPLQVENLLVGLTKPEVVGLAGELHIDDKLVDTVSCWQIGRTRTHCGICTPCLIRRIASETHGVPDVPYAADMFDDPATLNDPRARDNLAHLVASVDGLQQLSDVELEYEYPELSNGQPVLTLPVSIGMHRRWASQAADVLFAHPVPQSIR